MVHARRKKNSRQRGTTTHGWGSMKKHRGAGHRGGRGNAGSGKRGDAKKPSYWKDLKRYGKHGFNPYSKRRAAAVNVGHLASGIVTLAAQGIVTHTGGKYVVNLTDLGIDRLLGTGIVQEKLEITVDSASEKAVAKIEKAGGKVMVTRVESSSK